MVRTNARVSVREVKGCTLVCIEGEVNEAFDPAAIAGLRGVVVFDLNTLATYRGFFASTSLHDAGELVMVWSGATPADAAPGVLATALFIAFSRADDGSWTAARVTHRQRHHGEQDVRRALAAAGLRCVALYGQGVDGIPHPRLREPVDTKAVYVARHAR